MTQQPERNEITCANEPLEHKDRHRLVIAALAIVLVLLHICSPLLAQTTANTVRPSAAPEASLRPAPWTFDFGKIRDSFSKEFFEKAGAALGGASAAALAWIARAVWKRRQSLRFDWPRLQRPASHLIALLGQTTSGKTTLIKQLFHYPTDQKGAPDNDEITPALRLYTLLHEPKTSRESRPHRFDIIDYRGGEPKQIETLWPLAVKRLRHKVATAVILVIDLFDDDTEGEIDHSRLRKTVKYWESQLPDVTRAIGVSPRTVILFLNKIDLLHHLYFEKGLTGSGKRLGEAEETLKPLLNRLAGVFGRRAHYITGSALYGANINRILAELQRTAE